jgi:HEAT repeat protein
MIECMEVNVKRTVFYLDCFRKGDRDAAFFGLLELGIEIHHHLMNLFRIEPETNVRTFLVQVIWQSRQPSVIPFLAEALRDNEPTVWKQALDGLVSLASPEVLKVLVTALERASTADFRHWLEEAISQVEGNLKNGASSPGSRAIFR